MEIFLQTETWISLLTLTFLEIVLGIDNIIFISIVSDRLPEEKQQKARSIGLLLAIIIRIGLLFGISYIIHLTNPLLTIYNFELSIRDLILIAGGLFLLAKSVSEIHEKIEGNEDASRKNAIQLTMGKAIVQIVLLDVVFSFDSILTAVGLSDQVIIMVIAVLIALLIMLIFATKVSNFVNKNPTVKILALSFLIMIGTILIIEGFHGHVEKGYIYFSLAFSLFVEYLNGKFRKKGISI